MIYRKFRKISDRHQKGLFLSAGYELFIRLYRQQWFRLIARKLFASKKPLRWIFVVGCYNAGTTVVKDAIALHSEISTMPIEGDLLTQQMSNLEQGGWARCLYGNKKSIIANKLNSKLNTTEILKDWAPWIRSNKIFMDKAISHSCRLAQLRTTFGESCKFIVVTRNRNDVVSGINRRSVPSGIAKSQLGSSEYPQELLEAQWEFMYRMISSDAQSKDSFVISYEDFMERPEAVTRNAFEFLDLNDPGVTLRTGRLHVGIKSIALRTGKPQSGQRISDLDQLRTLHEVAV